MPLRTLSIAKYEAADAADYYIDRDWRTGLAFRAAYDAAIARIAADPSSLPWHHLAASTATRYHRVGRFPYVVLFSVADPAETIVLAVLHTAAGPRRFAAAERRA
ncbi:type II toxin-antitoxin system RelE/ParE family toxin [Alienimonas californiensis]|uniref:Plasmid stabilization system protein n=1 Tax=Alienimonas californiensis TaxID=2527989 RepID=A0A517PF89_9PLAN|nr:type II toxin-antitoxin system RelE/ParE family toxin [Alienimonas californiensis]QDT18025.1 hypothetical protein CA12_41630 [Alienimonas californiensis]